MRIERLDETTRKNLLEDLLKRSPNSYGTYEASVREILDEVKNRRDEAVFAYTEKFDGAALNADNIQVTEEEIQKAYSQVDSSLLNVIRKSLKNAMKMEEKAATDEMTGLYNKNKLLATIEKKHMITSRLPSFTGTLTV